MQISLHLKVRLRFLYRKFEMKENFNYGIVIFKIFFLPSLYFRYAFCFVKNVCFPVGMEKRHVFIRHAGAYFAQLKLN